MDKFEEAISDTIFRKTGHKVYTVGVNSGTTALYLCLRFLRENVVPDSARHIPTTPTSFWATSEAILAAGLIPSYEDIGERLQVPVLHDHTVVVSLHGHPVLGGYNAKYVIEDNAQCAPFHYNSECWASTYSLFPSKPLGTCTDGGYICTQDEELYDWLKRARYHGLDLSSDNRYVTTMSAGTMRLTEIPALYAWHKLQVLEDLQDKRVSVAKMYCEKLDLPFYEDSYYHVMNINVPDREEVVKTLLDSNVECNFHYPHTLEEQCIAAKSQYRALGILINAENHARTCLSLPLHPFMCEEDVDRIVGVVNDSCVSA